MANLHEGVSSAFDVYITYKFLRELTKSWVQTDAYRLGILDADGNKLKSKDELETKEEKDSYTVFHRLVYNIKRLMEKVPGGKSKLLNYATAAWLIKENKEYINTSIISFLNEEESPVNKTGADVAIHDPKLFMKPLKRTTPTKNMEKEKITTKQKPTQESAVVRLNKLLLNMPESKRIVKVVRHNTLMKKTQCSPNQKVVDGKCATKTSKDKLVLARASRKRQRTLAGKSQSARIRKQQRSDKKRTSLGL